MALTNFYESTGKASGTHARTDCARKCDQRRDEQNRAAAEVRPVKDYFLR
jgi:hypothetical protein